MKEIAEDISDSPGIYYPEYLLFCTQHGLAPVDRAQWREMAVR